MKTVLLWGNAWWVGGRYEPLRFESLDGAAAALAAHFSEKKPRIRLIYQPDILESVPVYCPKAGRDVLAQALGEDFPALANASNAWSHEPILPLGAQYKTILHFEREPALFTLVAGLEQLGFAVDSAWPLGAFLWALPKEQTDSGAFTVVAVQPEGACAYRRANDGQRSITSWRGGDALKNGGQFLVEILAKNAAERFYLTFAGEESAEEFEKHVSLTDKARARWLALTEALASDVILPRHHPAQFLPSVPFVTAQQAAVAASVAVLLLACWSGGLYARDCFAWQKEGETRVTQKHALQIEVAHLRANAAEIAASRATLAGLAANPPYGEFLEKLSSSVPAEIALDSLRIDPRQFILNGHVAAAAPTGGWERWRARFLDPRWSFSTNAVPDKTGAFTLVGGFKP